MCSGCLLLLFAGNYGQNNGSQQKHQFKDAHRVEPDLVVFAADVDQQGSDDAHCQKQLVRATQANELHNEKGSCDQAEDQVIGE